MGRIKQGLDYFPMSTSFMHDRIVRRVMKREGDAAFATLVETLSYIYAGKGYYIPASDEFYDELTDSLYNTDLDDVKRIIALAVECGLVDSGLFPDFRRYPTAVSLYHQAAQQLVDSPRLLPVGSGRACIVPHFSKQQKQCGGC